MQFDFENIRHCEFGVAKDINNGQQEFALVPVNRPVQDALREMAEATSHAMHENEPYPQRYDPGEKHGSTEHLILPIDDDLAQSMRDLHRAENLPEDSAALDDVGRVFAYFARFRDGRGRRLTALRRATQFKGVVSPRSRLVRWFDDELVLEEDRVFKLDADFDLLVDDYEVHIWRPSGFEFAGRLKDAILAAVPRNVAVLRQQIAFVSWDSIEHYAQRHSRAARYLASIRQFDNLERIDQQALMNACEENGVDVAVEDGTVRVAQGHELSFLLVLDRRRYEVELVPGEPERFEAASRRKL